jgi:hypothetical protein
MDTGRVPLIRDGEASMARPELMAIGDSLGNGVRSLTIDRDLAAHSVSAQVARAFNWEFITPDYPRPMLANFERIFRDPFSGTLDLLRNAANNAHAWLADQRWSQQPMFHNLSIAQQVVSDVYTANYAASLATAANIAAQGVGMPIASLPNLYQALNTCFVLNPGRTPNDTRTAVDILAEARPKRLLIHIGVNNGLWTLLLLADPTNYTTRINPIPSMHTLALRLRDRCPDIEHFYINFFPKPSAIANLMPPWAGGDPPRPSNGYYTSYVGDLLGNGGITGDKMREIDTWIADVLNPQMRDAFAPLGDRVHFVDLYASSATYDRKNGINTKEVLLNRGPTEFLLDNRAIAVTPFGGLSGFGGGLFGLDNLHPTLVGYGIIAQSVCDVIAATEGVPAPTISLQACYDADTLLNNLPATIGLADFALEFVGAYISGGSLSSTA